jgi:hypothetical protein
MARRKVQQARPSARPQPRAAGGPKKVARQAARAARRTPQPPAAPVAAGPGGYELAYTPTAESRLNQPYQDIIAAGGTLSLADVLGRLGQQGQMADIYGGGAAEQLGGAAAGMRGLAGLGGQYGDVSGLSLGQYEQLMRPNLAIQQQIAQQIQDIQAGKADFDPFLTQQFNQQETLLREQLRRNLGPDYESSTPGIEALARFNQNKTTTLGSAQFQRLNELVGMQQQGMGAIGGQGLNFGQFGQGVQGQQFGQGATLGQMYGAQAQDLYNQAIGLRQAQLGGAGQMLNQAAATQQLYAGVPQTMGQFGQAMAGQAGAAVQAQDPYRADRMAQLQASYEPTKGQFLGEMMAQSGNRWANIGGAVGGMGPKMTAAGAGAAG